MSHPKISSPDDATSLEVESVACLQRQHAPIANLAATEGIAQIYLIVNAAAALHGRPTLHWEA
jgi:hypothetical protein